MNCYEHDFMQKQLKKREDYSKANEIYRLNLQAQNFIRLFNHKLDLLSNEKEALKIVNSLIVQSTVLNLKYRNNFESIKVLGAQMELLNYLLVKYPDESLFRAKIFLNQSMYNLQRELDLERGFWKRKLTKLL